MLKLDLYNHEQRYKDWKHFAEKKGYTEEGLTKINSSLLIKYIFDMEIGQNVSNGGKKGGRTFCRLNTLRTRMIHIFKMLQDRGCKDIAKVKEEEVALFFTDMRNGIIKTHKGHKYKSVSDYVKIFKAFWHWWMKLNKKTGMIIPDITTDLDSRSDEKPEWVYLDEKQIDLLIQEANPRYKSLLAFLFDSGARVTETLSLRVSNITQENGEIFVFIPQVISKSTFDRKFKLMLCGKDLMEYIKKGGLKEDDLLFPFSGPLINGHLNELGEKILGKGHSKAGEKYSNLTMYDFRHNSVCYWIQRYKTNSAIMYRFGWKSEEYIHYYSEFLGMKDPIKQEDLYIDITKAELEKDIVRLKKDDNAQKGRIERLEGEFKDLLDKYRNLAVTVKISDEMTSKNAKIKKEFRRTAGNMMASGKLNPFH